MYAFHVSILVIFQFCLIKSETNLISDHRYQKLPLIFHIDEYEPCKEGKKLFCKVSIVLSPRDKNVSDYWKIIEATIEEKQYYNHNELFHAICANDFCSTVHGNENNDELKKKLSNCYSAKYENLGLNGNVTYVNCENHDNVYKAGVLDFTVLFMLITYGSFIIFATVCNYQIHYEHKRKSYISKEFESLFITPFSVISNWKKLRKTNESPDFQKLKSIQGIRFYNTLLIIFCHTVSSYIGGYVSNTDYFETSHENLIRLIVRTLFVFLVQTFFLVSAFLLSYHIFQIMDKYPKFKIRYIFLTLLNRYLRIIPPVLVMVCLGTTIWIVNLFYGPIKDLYSDIEYQRCQKNWWTTLLFVNNHYNQHDMCYFITWYLAADTQLYVLSLIILSLIWIFRNRTKSILINFVLIGILIPSIISYIYKLDIIYRITPENSKNNKFRSFTFNAIYSSTYTNMATYMIGLLFGYIYCKVGHQNICQSSFFVFLKVYKVIWAVLFIGLPSFVIYASFYEYERFYSAILSGILKPLYAAGIGIGILGMSQKIGGVAKKICEWKPALFMGNFTYSTYVVHYGLVFYRTATATKPRYVSDYVLLTSFIRDAILSFFCGFLMHILVEMPASQIQNMLVPQVRKHRTENKKMCIVVKNKK